MSIDLLELVVTQNGLRFPESIRRMIAFVKNGGFWTEEQLTMYAAINLTRIAPLISISKFTDGKFFIHDGHHRVISTYLAGRPFLRDDEFSLTSWTYSQYADEVSHDRGWYTPFDPRTHIRLADFSTFKKEAKQKFIDGLPEQEIIQWIYNNTNQFCAIRDIYTVAELAEESMNQLKVA